MDVFSSSHLLKKARGQFFTVTNPFRNDLFYKWKSLIPEFETRTLLEPFAGANNIPAMLRELEINNDWACFDIDPPRINNHPSTPVVCRDSLSAYPADFCVAITNPPYLAKNSARRDGIQFPKTSYDDLYKYCLHVMLENTGYVAAIVPESFITASLFEDRLFGIISLTCKMFEDTECPVCLALFVPAQRKTHIDLNLANNDYHIYRDSAFLGFHSDMIKHKIENRIDGWKFNVPEGEIGLLAIDGQKEPSIRFCDGNEIDPKRIKHTSRGVTRIDAEFLKELDKIKLLQDANQILYEYRKNTNDIFLTSFRGLRADGKYRRRLDFEQARRILSKAVEVQVSNKC